MSINVVTLVLLLFGQQINTGHALSKIESSNTSDVYSVSEDKTSNVIAIVNPIPDKPTLREIVYNHFIEKAYARSGEDSQQIVNPDFDDTKRSFTNGHGYQFLDTDPKQIDNKSSRSKRQTSSNVTENLRGDTITGENIKSDILTPMEDERKPSKTYGMSLTNGHGYIWNDLTDPKVSFHVGEQESDDENKDIQKAPESGIGDKSNILTLIEHKESSESDISNEINNTKHVSSADDNKEVHKNKKDEVYTETPDLTNESIPEIETNNNDSFVKQFEQNITFTTEETEKNENDESPDKNPNKNDLDYEEANSDERDEQIRPGVIDKDLSETDKDRNKDKEQQVDNEDKPPCNKPKEINMQHILKELFDNNEFWKRLGDPTNKYLDMFMERIISGFIQDHIAMHLHAYFETHNICEICKNNPGNDFQTSNRTSKKQSINSINNELNTDVESNTDRQGTSVDIQYENSDEETKDDLSKKHKDKFSANNSTSIEKEPTVKVKAQTVYGNSVDNGKVTNIFIFNYHTNNGSNPLINETYNNEYIPFGTTENITDDEKNTGNDQDIQKDNTEIPALDSQVPEDRESIDVNTTDSHNINNCGTGSDHECSTTEYIDVPEKEINVGDTSDGIPPSDNENNEANFNPIDKAEKSTMKDNKGLHEGDRTTESSENVENTAIKKENNSEKGNELNGTDNKDTVVKNNENIGNEESQNSPDDDVNRIENLVIRSLNKLNNDGRLKLSLKLL